MGLRFLLLLLPLVIVGASEECMASMASSGPRTVPFALVGLGGVGSALVEAILGAKEHHLKTYGVTLQATFVSDSSGALLAAGGMSDGVLADVAKHKASGASLLTYPGGTPRPRDVPAGEFLEAAGGALAPKTVGGEVG